MNQISCTRERSDSHINKKAEQSLFGGERIRRSNRSEKGMAEKSGICRQSPKALIGNRMLETKCTDIRIPAGVSIKAILHDRRLHDCICKQLLQIRQCVDIGYSQSSDLALGMQFFEYAPNLKSLCMRAHRTMQYITIDIFCTQIVQ